MEDRHDDGSSGRAVSIPGVVITNPKGSEPPSIIKHCIFIDLSPSVIGMHVAVSLLPLPNSDDSVLYRGQLRAGRAPMETKKILLVVASCLLLAGIAGTGDSSADGPGIEMRAGDFKMLSPHAFWPSSGCPDIAHTKTFQSRGLGYVGTPEFAEAIRAVAYDASEYSPAEVPPDWRIAAENWIEYMKMTRDEESNRFSPSALFQLRGGEELLFPKGKYACNADLVHLASLEYRKMQLREDAPQVFPRYVHAATKELQEIIATKRQMARSFAQRMTAIGSKIAEAERLQAGSCSPGEVARAKRELERAFIEARTVQATLPETVLSFERAERMANILLEPHLFASSGGGICQ